MQHNLSKKEQDLVTIALPRAEKIMERHIRLPDLNKIPPGSLSGGINGEELELEGRVLDTFKEVEVKSNE